MSTSVVRNSFLLFHSEDRGVWSQEKEARLFVVPSCHYGYVDCEWYLDIRLPEAVGRKCSRSHGYGMKGRQAMACVLPLAEREAPNGASACVDFPALAYSAVTGYDSVDATARHRWLFSAAVSVEHSPSDGCNSNEISRVLPLFKRGLRLHVRQGSFQPNERTTPGTNVLKSSPQPPPEMLRNASSCRSPQMVSRNRIVQSLIVSPLAL